MQPRGPIRTAYGYLKYIKDYTRKKDVSDKLSKVAGYKIMASLYINNKFLRKKLEENASSKIA